MALDRDKRLGETVTVVFDSHWGQYYNACQSLITEEGSLNEARQSGTVKYRDQGIKGLAG